MSGYKLKSEDNSTKPSNKNPTKSNKSNKSENEKELYETALNQTISALVHYGYNVDRITSYINTLYNLAYD